MILPHESTKKAEEQPSALVGRASVWRGRLLCALCDLLRIIRHPVPLLIIAAFVTGLFWAKARDPFRRIEFSLKTSGGKTKGIAVLPRKSPHAGPLPSDGRGRTRTFPVVVYLHGSGGSLMNSGKDLRLIAEQGLAAVGLEYNQTNQSAFDEEFVALHEFLRKQKWIGSARVSRAVFGVPAENTSANSIGVGKTSREPPDVAGGTPALPATAWIGFSLGAQRQLSFLARHPEYAPELVVRAAGGAIEQVPSSKFQVPRLGTAGRGLTEGNEGNKGEASLSSFPSVGNPRSTINNPPSATAFLLVHGENDEVFSVEDCRRVEEWLKAQGAAVETRILSGQNHSFGMDRSVVMRGVAEYCANVLYANDANSREFPKPLQINLRPLHLTYWIPFGLLTGFVGVRWYLRWRKSAAHIPRGKVGVVILCLAWVLGIAAAVETTIRLGLPRLEASEARLNFARSRLVQPKLREDFDWLISHLQKEAKGTEEGESGKRESGKVETRIQAGNLIGGGTTIGVLLEHLELADYSRGLVNWKVEDAIYREFVLSPVIEPPEARTINLVAGDAGPVDLTPGETQSRLTSAATVQRVLTGSPVGEREWRRSTETPLQDLDWRRPLWENFYPRIRKENDPVSAAEIIVRFLRERVTVVSGEVPYEGVRSIWQSELTDTAGFERIYVAALRSAGIPSRLSGQGLAEIFAEERWMGAPRPLFGAFAPAIQN